MKDWLTALCPEIGQWQAELIEDEVTRWRANDKALMQQALDALEYINTHYFVLADHEGPLEQAIPALRKALAADALDRLAAANRELNLGEN